MRRSFLAILGAVMLALSGMPDDAYAEIDPPEEATYSPQQLEQILAPIALYPDTLLIQVLTAATYPIEVIEAYRWVSEPENAALEGDALAAALESQDWDPSVKALVPFPQILKNMNDELGWMRQLGDAYLFQGDDVMAAVQRLRAQAIAAGNLESGEQANVVYRDRTIYIEPPAPSVMYVPVYDPFFAFGTWRWSAFPPVCFNSFGVQFIQPGFFGFVPFSTVTFIRFVTVFDGHHHRRFHRHHDRPTPRVHDHRNTNTTVIADDRDRRDRRRSTPVVDDRRTQTATRTTSTQTDSPVVRHLRPSTRSSGSFSVIAKQEEDRTAPARRLTGTYSRSDQATTARSWPLLSPRSSTGNTTRSAQSQPRVTNSNTLTALQSSSRPATGGTFTPYQGPSRPISSGAAVNSRAFAPVTQSRQVNASPVRTPVHAEYTRPQSSVASNYSVRARNSSVRSRPAGRSQAQTSVQSRASSSHRSTQPSRSVSVRSSARREAAQSSSMGGVRARVSNRY